MKYLPLDVKQPTINHKIQNEYKHQYKTKETKKTARKKWRPITRAWAKNLLVQGLHLTTKTHKIESKHPYHQTKKNNARGEWRAFAPYAQ